MRPRSAAVSFAEAFASGSSPTYMGAVARSVRFGGDGELFFAYDPTDDDVPIIAGGSTVTMVE